MRGSYILSTQVSTSDFSSDLSGGRRPESKSDEKLEVDTLIHDLSRCEHSFTVKKVLQLFRASAVRIPVDVMTRMCTRTGDREKSMRAASIKNASSTRILLCRALCLAVLAG